MGGCGGGRAREGRDRGGWEKAEKDEMGEGDWTGRGKREQGGKEGGDEEGGA